MPHPHLPFYFLSIALVASAFAECPCAVGEHTPKVVTISPCQQSIDIPVSAPITCSSTGRAEGTAKTLPPPSEDVTEITVPVHLEGKCEHSRIVKADRQLTVEFDDGIPCGEFTIKQESIHVKMSLGYTTSRHMAGRLRLDIRTPTPSMYRYSALSMKSNRANDIVEEDGVKTYFADQCAVVLANDGDEAFTATFFPASDIERERRIRIDLLSRTIDGRTITITNEVPYYVYALSANASPMVVYRFENPEPGTCRALRVSQTWAGAAAKTWLFSWNGGTWTLDEGGVRTRILVSAELADGRRTTETVSSSNGIPATTVVRDYRSIAGQDRLVREVIDPAGLALVSTWDYEESGDLAGFVRSEHSWDGSWHRYERAEDGRLLAEESGWLGGGTNDPCRRREYSYAPLPAVILPTGVNADTGSTDATTPRVETEFIAGIAVSKTLRAISLDADGYRRIEEVRLLDPAETNLVAAWSDPANLRTLSVYMPDSDFKPCSRLPSLLVRADGTSDWFDYESGTYTNNSDGTPGVFATMRGGAVFRTVVTHGTREIFGLDAAGLTTNDYAGIPFRTTREVRYETRIDKKELARETWVCTGPDSWERLSWTTFERNREGHVVATVSSDGSRSEQGWSGEQLAWRTDENGIRTDYEYDGLGRRIAESHVDPLTGETIRVVQTLDANGRTLRSVTTAGILEQSEEQDYDPAGRLVRSLGADGVETAYDYQLESGVVRETTVRGIGTDCAVTNVMVSYADGQTVRFEQNGHCRESYVYFVETNGALTTIAYEGPAGTNSPCWTSTLSDALGRTVEERRPGFGGTILSDGTTYNEKGQAVRHSRQVSFPEGTTEARPATLLLYDELGATITSATDANGNGMIDFIGPDVVSSNAMRFVHEDGVWWRESRRFTFPDTGSAEPCLVGTTRTRLSDFGGTEQTEIGPAELVAETRSIDALGNVHRFLRYRNRATHATLSRSVSPSSILSDDTIQIGSAAVTNRSSTGVTTTRRYDHLGRVVSITDGRGNTISLEYDAFGRIARTSDATGATTSFGYDALGRQVAVTNALGLVTTKTYDADGNVVAQGGAQYPVCYSYDGYGRMIAMSTYRSEDISHADVTTWLYDEATGLTTNKVYADGKGPNYTYTPDGLLATRTWARGIVTAYSYDTLGNLVAVDYSDTTPDITYTRDRLGNVLLAVTDGVATNAYAYNRLGQVTNEVQNGTTIARSYDALGRATGYVIGDGEASGSVASYSYDALGRFASVSSGTNTFSYSYLPGADLVSEMTANTGHTWERIYETDRDLIATVHNRYGNRTISRFDYTNDEIGRRIARVDSGEAFAETAFERYAYNDRSEVIGSQRFYGSDISDISRPVTGRTFGYGYDPIGNRVFSFGDVGGERLTTTYAANELNQYTAIQNPGAVPLRGDAKREAVVTVNGEQTERDNGTAAFTPWSYSLPSGAATAHFQNTDILAVAQNAAGEDVEQRESGSAFVPAAETLLAYDDDGNMTFDGRFRYSWNGENRMIRAEEIVSPTNRTPTIITYAYDEQGRMVSKNIDGTNIITRSLLWDGYNIVRETENGMPTYNIWGLDLDGTLQGCGGVGGLLAVAKTNGPHIALYDSNGNVSDYVSATGSLSAHYEYSPFGESIVSFGEFFMCRFSTKPYCPSTAFIEYQLRKYCPSLGRWMNRDPHGEQVGFNLFSFCSNFVNSRFDYLGAESISLLDRLVSALTSGLERTTYGRDGSKLIANPFIPAISAHFQIHAFWSILVSPCCDKGKLGFMYRVQGGLEAFLQWGHTVQNVIIDGKERKDGTYQIAPRLEGYDIPIPNKGFRDRNHHIDFSSQLATCPESFVIGAWDVNAFVRGTAGIGIVGVQASLQYKINARNFDPDGLFDLKRFKADGSIAWGVAGLSLEVGLNGSFGIEGKVL